MSGSVTELFVSMRRPIIVATSIIAIFFIITMGFIALTMPDWSTGVAFRAWTESQHDMVIDSEGDPNVACLGISGPYYSLNFAELINEEWEITPLKVLNRDYHGVSIALDSQDGVYICTGSSEGDYAKESHLTFATNRNGSWFVEDIPIGYYRYISSAIAVDSKDAVHILCSGYGRISWRTSYDIVYSYVGHLLHFYETPGGWERSEVFTPVENATTRIESFTIGVGDFMHALTWNIVHPWSIYDRYGSSYLNYSSTLSGNWTQEIVASYGHGGLNRWLDGQKSMVIDDDSNAHICGYLWNNASASYAIAYVSNANGEWSLSNLSYAGNAWPTWCSMTLDSIGAVHIAYYADFYDSANGVFNQTERYLTNRDGTWRCQVIDDKRGWSFSQRICIALGCDDRVHISYFADLGNHEIGSRYAIVYTTPMDGTEGLKDAVVVASWYTIGAGLIVGAGVLAYWRIVKWKLSEQQKKAERLLSVAELEGRIKL